VNSMTMQHRLHRLRRVYSRIAALTPKPPASSTEVGLAIPASPPVTSRVARMLALAHLVDRLVESGRFRDFAHAAKTFGVTRARMSQLMDLRYLPSPVQEDVLLGRTDLSERGLRCVARTRNPPA